MQSNIVPAPEQKRALPRQLSKKDAEVVRAPKIVQLRPALLLSRFSSSCLWGVSGATVRSLCDVKACASNCLLSHPGLVSSGSVACSLRHY